MEKKIMENHQKKQYNGGYPVYDNTRFTPYALRENANTYVSIPDTKTQVCRE